MEVIVLFTSLQNIVIFVNNSHNTWQCKVQNVICPHNATHKLCIFAIFSKTDFVDIAPSCCKPSSN